MIGPRDPCVLFLDCSKSDDATALMLVRVSDGHAVTIDMWQRPPGTRGDDWLVSRDKVDARVIQCFEQYTIVGFFADPSHTLDDERRTRYWDATIDEWHRRYKGQLKIWAVPGQRGHSVNFDMTIRQNLGKFVAVAELTAEEIKDRKLTHDGDPRLRIHVRNARNYPTDEGTSLGKESRESRKKCDLAVAWVGARMVRRLYLNSLSPEKKRSGGYW